MPQEKFMGKLWQMVEEFFSRLPLPEWSHILALIAPTALRSFTNWLLKQSVKYNRTRLESTRNRVQKKLISLGPSPDYVQGLLDDLLTRQEIWLHAGKSKFEVLIRTLGWGLQFIASLTRMTWDNVWITAHKKEEKRNKEG
jgi:hypothetical protein